MRFVTPALNQTRKAFHEIETLAGDDAAMNIRLLRHPIQLVALGAAVLRGVYEFIALQRWRLRDWRSR